MDWQIKRRADLARGAEAAAKPASIRPLAYPGDGNAHEWVVTVTDNGAYVDLSGVTVTGYFYRHADGATPFATGTISGNVATVQIPSAAYALGGYVTGILRAARGDVLMTLDCIVFPVGPNVTGEIIDPGTVIQDIDALVAAIHEAVESIPENYTALEKEVNLSSSAIDKLYRFADTGDLSPNSGKFVAGVVNASTGAVVTTQKYCAVLNDIVTANEDSTIIVDDGYDIRKFVYVNGVYAPDSSLTWGAKINIYKGQSYRYSIRRSNYSTAEIADIVEFTNAAHYRTIVGELKDAVVNGYNVIPIAYWINGTIAYDTGENTTSAYLCRLSTRRKLTYDHDVYLVAKRGYAIRVYCYSDDGSYTPYSYELSEYDFTSKPVLIPANTLFKVVVMKRDEDISSVANIYEFAYAVRVLDTETTKRLYESSLYHKNPKDYYALKMWIDAIIRAVEIQGDHMPTSYVSRYEDGYRKGYFLPATNYSAAFYRDADIYFNSNIASWISMLKNPASDIFTETWTWDKTNSNRNAYFGAVCSSFVSYLLGQDVFYRAAEYYASSGDPNVTSAWASARVMDSEWIENELFKWTDVASIDDLEIGDIYVCAKATTGGGVNDHVALVSDVGCDDEGDYVVLFEQYKPDARVTRYTNEAFMERLAEDSARVCRFKDHHHIRSPREIDLSYNLTCIPNRGDKSFYYVGDVLKLYVPDDGAVTIKLKDTDAGTGWTVMSPISSETVDDGIVYSLSGFASGNYHLTVDDGETYSQVAFVDVGGVEITSDGSVVCSGYKNCEPLWCMSMVLSRPISSGAVDPKEWRDTTYNYNGGDYPALIYLGTKKKVEGSEFNAIVPTGSMGRTNGWYVRVMYKTPFGQAHCDSNLILPS